MLEGEIDGFVASCAAKTGFPRFDDLHLLRISGLRAIDRASEHHVTTKGRISRARSRPTRATK